MSAFGRRASWLSLALLCLSCASWSAAVRAQESVAHVASARGQVSAHAADGTVRALRQGDAVHIEERVTTGRGAAVQLAFTDESRVSLGARADMTINQYRRAEDDESFVMTITRGAFRVLTGLVAKSRPQAVRVDMTVGTIGIRGTHFGGEVHETSATVVLLAPEGTGDTAIEVSNAFGAVVIEQPGFGTDIPDAASPPSAVRRMRVRAIDNLIRSLTTIPRPPPPRVPGTR